MSDYRHLRVERRDSVLSVTIDRPAQRNPLSTEVLRELRNVFTAATDDMALRAAVVTGAGDKSFAAGGDLKEFDSLRSTADAERLWTHANEALRAVREFPLPVVAALNPTRRAAAMNWLHSFYCVGAVVTILAGSVVLKLGFGWRTACLLLAPLPLGLLVAFAPLQFPALSAPGGKLQLRKMLRLRWFWAAMIAICLGGATELGMAQWLPAYAEISLGYAPWVGGSALLLFSVAMALGRMVVGAAGPRWNPFRVMAWCCALAVVLFLLGSFLPVPWMALTACIAAGFAGSCLWPTMLAVTADRYPDGGATMFGALAAIGNMGGIFMPWVVGWVADQCNLHWGLAVSALAPALMLPLVLGMRRR